jgi:general secretion pathway protein C
MLNFLGKAVTGMALNGIALGALGWVAWDASMRGFPGSMTPDPTGLPSLEGPARESGVAIEAIVGAHLFGREQVRRVSAPPPAAPATRLDLKLAGVIAMGSDSDGIALIGVGRGQQQVVRVGQGIGATGALLAEVRRDHVLIERNGRLEKLSIERPGLE